MSLPSADTPSPIRTVFPVRPASLRDAKSIAEIHVSAWQEAARLAGPPEARPADSVERRQAAWREAIDLCEPQVLVATERDKVIGFVAFDRSRDKGTPSTTGEVWALYVAPSHWGRGVGLALWDAARDGLQEEGCIRTTMWLPMRFERAMRFVSLAGFKRETGSAQTVEVGGIRIEEIRVQRGLV
ncbi:MAG: GNAT family N-acetyltransferase [Ideonella sp.]|nr:GNAT family N-acetyltransferase [Ideonella sp.]